jgi:hypothetical protein
MPPLIVSQYMPSLTRIICLANSSKLSERCIAGINPESGKWVRPVCDSLYPQDGRVPSSTRLIGEKEPEPLDILGVPLDETGNDFGFECENFAILTGKWEFLGRANPRTLIAYCKNLPNILHNDLKYVNPSYLQSLSFHERHTLQLIQSTNFFVTGSASTGWRGTIRTANGQTLNEAKITDPVFTKKLGEGYQPKGNCLVTVSLSMPWAPRDDWEGEKPCWKLIAGVMEL